MSQKLLISSLRNVKEENLAIFIEDEEEKTPSGASSSFGEYSEEEDVI